MEANAARSGGFAERIEDRIGPRLEQARQTLSRLDERIVDFARERPGTLLLGALALGFVLGKLASRREGRWT